MLGSKLTIFGLFGKGTSKNEKAQKEDVELTLKQKRKELHEIEKLIQDMKDKAVTSIQIDKHISAQQQRLEELEALAGERLREFEKAEKLYKIQQKDNTILNEKRKLLSKKEELLSKKEHTADKKEKHALVLTQEIKRTDRHLEDRHARIKAHIVAEEKRLGIMKANIYAARKELANLAPHMRRLKAEQKALTKVQAEIQKKAAWIADHEKNLSRRSRDIHKQTNHLRHAKEIIAQSNHLKREAEIAVKDKKRYAEEATRLIAQNNKRLDELKATEKKISSLHHDIEKREKAMADKAEELDRKEQMVLKREMDWLKHQNDLKDLAETLAKDRKEIDEIVNNSKAELANLKQEASEKFEGLKDEKKFLSTQKSEIHRLVKTDIAALKEKEQELLHAVKEFTKDQKRLEKEESAVIARVKTLEKKSKEVHARETKLAEQEKSAQKIIAEAEKAKALKIDVPKLKREYKSLKSEIRKLESVGARKGAVRVHVAHAAKHAEHLEKSVPKLRAHVKAEKALKKHTTGDDVHSMIESARSSVESGDVSSALSILDDLEKAARKMKDGDRKQLDYEIRDLRTSIKLATL